MDSKIVLPRGITGSGSRSIHLRELGKKPLIPLFLMARLPDRKYDPVASSPVNGHDIIDHHISYSASVVCMTNLHKNITEELFLSQGTPSFQRQEKKRNVDLRYAPP